MRRRRPLTHSPLLARQSHPVHRPLPGENRHLPHSPLRSHLHPHPLCPRRPPGHRHPHPPPEELPRHPPLRLSHWRSRLLQLPEALLLHLPLLHRCLSHWRSRLLQQRYLSPLCPSHPSPSALSSSRHTPLRSCGCTWLGCFCMRNGCHSDTNRESCSNGCYCTRPSWRRRTG